MYHEKRIYSEAYTRNEIAVVMKVHSLIIEIEDLLYTHYHELFDRGHCRHKQNTYEAHKLHIRQNQGKDRCIHS